MSDSALQSELPPPCQLALAYTPKRVRPVVLGLLALDWRLATLVNGAREPMLAQLKLAWWRDRLAEPPSAWPKGEPQLALLTGWGEQADELGGLVDGWEALLLEGDPGELIEGRARAGAALARVAGLPTAASSAGLSARLWSMAEFGVAADGVQDLPVLPRELRALTVLVRLAGQSGQSRLRQFLVVMRTGLFGR